MDQNKTKRFKRVYNESFQQSVYFILSSLLTDGDPAVWFLLADGVSEPPLTTAPEALTPAPTGM